MRMIRSEIRASSPSRSGPNSGSGGTLAAESTNSPFAGRQMVHDGRSASHLRPVPIVDPRGPEGGRMSYRRRSGNAGSDGSGGRRTTHRGPRAVARAGLEPLRRVGDVWLTSWGHDPELPTAERPLLLSGPARRDGALVSDGRVAQLLRDGDVVELGRFLPPFAAVGLAPQGPPHRHRPDGLPSGLPMPRSELGCRLHLRQAPGQPSAAGLGRRGGPPPEPARLAAGRSARCTPASPSWRLASRCCWRHRTCVVDSAHRRTGPPGLHQRSTTLWTTPRRSLRQSMTHYLR